MKRRLLSADVPEAPGALRPARIRDHTKPILQALRPAEWFDADTDQTEARLYVGCAAIARLRMTDESAKPGLSNDELAAALAAVEDELADGVTSESGAVAPAPRAAVKNPAAPKKVVPIPIPSPHVVGPAQPQPRPPAPEAPAPDAPQLDGAAPEPEPEPEPERPSSFVPVESEAPATKPAKRVRLGWFARLFRRSATAANADSDATSAASPAGPRTSLLVRAFDKLLDLVNRPFVGLSPAVRYYIGVIGLATIGVSILAVIIMPYLAPPRDAVSFLKERRAALRVAPQAVESPPPPPDPTQSPD